jgi:hypothetical protein
MIYTILQPLCKLLVITGPCIIFFISVVVKPYFISFLSRKWGGNNNYTHTHLWSMKEKLIPELQVKRLLKALSFKNSVSLPSI